MTEAKHTPGPWQGCLHLRSDADEKCGCGYVGGIWSTASDFMICEMGPSGEGSDMIPIPDRDEVKANALLIAAAPDLLEALTTARKYLKKAPFSVFVMIDAAISKATTPNT